MTLSHAWQTLKEAADRWTSRPLDKPVSGQLTASSDAKNIAVPGRAFAPEASYFSVRIVEMNLAEGGKYFTQFLPLAVCMAEYTMGTERQRTPLILSNDKIAEQLNKEGVTPGLVEYKNMYVVRRAPVKADNLSLFVGLFRMPYTDVAKQMLQIAADITDQVGGVPASQGIRVAEKVYDGIAGLFGLNTMTPLLGYADGNALVDSGYFVVAGPASKGLTLETLNVVGDRLHQTDHETTQLATGFDYCLFALEQTATLFPDGPGSINSLVDLAFHKRWRTVAQLLAANKVKEADAEMPQLRSEVVVSPDLTEEDRLIAIAAYETAYEKFRKVLVKPDATPAETRAGIKVKPKASTLADGLFSEEAARKGTDGADVGFVLGKMAQSLNQTRPAPELKEGKLEMADSWFLEEASNMRKSLASSPATRPNAAKVAEAISGAASRRYAGKK